MTDHDLWKQDATAQAQLVRCGDVSPAELLDCAIDRIDRLNPALNAVITPLYDLAREQLASLDRDAPFAGVPLLLKDASIEVEGTPYFIGTSALRDIGYRSHRTTELARRLRRAGFVFLGKTNCAELSAGSTTEPLAFGPTRNPWDTARTAGGSSGGSAAAVAAGMVSIAHGGDAGGSLRYPAACCGVATLKPSRGRIPSETPAAQPDGLGVWTEFVLARTVRDLSGVFAAIADPGPVPPAPAGLRTRSLRVGLMTRDLIAGMEVDPACAQAVAITGRLLAQAGHAVETAHPPALAGWAGRIWRAFGIVTPPARAAQVRWLEAAAGRPMTEGDLDPETLQTIALAANITPEQQAAAAGTLRAESTPILDWWRDYDILVTPVTRQPAWPLGLHGGAADAGVFPVPFSFTGQPAMSVPVHWSDAGLPAAVQLVGPVGGDELLLALAAQIEEAAPWSHRWPPLAEELPV